MRYFSLISYLVFLCHVSYGQITAVQTVWDDSFREWNVYAVDIEGEEIEGHLRMRWIMNDDWSEWDYRIGEDFGFIKVKWKGNMNQWELRGGNEIIDIQTIFKDDPSRWRIRSGSQILNLDLNKRDVPYDWRMDNSNHGFFEIYTEWEQDPRSWIIVDETSEDVSIHMKMAITFFSIFSSIPRF